MQFQLEATNSPSVRYAFNTQARPTPPCKGYAPASPVAASFIDWMLSRISLKCWFLITLSGPQAFTSHFEDTSQLRSYFMREALSLVAGA